MVDPLKWGHCIINLSIKDTVQGPKITMPYSVSTFRTSKRGQSLYKGQNRYCPQRVLYSEVPLYCTEV